MLSGKWKVLWCLSERILKQEWVLDYLICWLSCVFPLMVKLHFLQVCILYGNPAFQFVSMSIFKSGKVYIYCNWNEKSHFPRHLFSVVSWMLYKILQRSSPDPMYTKLTCSTVYAMHTNKLIISIHPGREEYSCTVLIIKWQGVNLHAQTLCSHLSGTVSFGSLVPTSQQDFMSVHHQCSLPCELLICIGEFNTNKRQE